MIQNLIFGILFLENIISVLGIQLFIFVTYFSQNNQIFFFFFFLWFSSRKPQSQQKLAKKGTHFTIQFHSKNLTQFKNLNLLDIENNMF